MPHVFHVPDVPNTIVTAALVDVFKGAEHMLTKPAFLKTIANMMLAEQTVQE